MEIDNGPKLDELREQGVIVQYNTDGTVHTDWRGTHVSSEQVYLAAEEDGLSPYAGMDPDAHTFAPTAE